MKFKLGPEFDYGWVEHDVTDEEYSWWQKVEKLFRLSFSENPHESGLALHKLEKMMDNNPWGYIDPDLEKKFPGFGAKYYKSKPIKLAEKISAVRIKKFNVANVAVIEEKKSKTKLVPVTNPKTRNLFELLVFMGYMHFYAKPEEQRTKKYWLSFRQMLNLMPSYIKKTADKDKGSTLRSDYQNYIRNNGVATAKASVRCKTSGRKTDQGWGEIPKFAILIDEFPLQITYQKKD